MKSDSYSTIKTILLFQKCVGLIPYSLNKQNQEWVFTKNICGSLFNATTLAIAVLSNGLTVLEYVKRKIKHMKDVYDVFHILSIAIFTCTIFTVLHLKCQRIINALKYFQEDETVIKHLVNNTTPKRRNASLYITICRSLMLLCFVAYDMLAITWKGFWRLSPLALINTYFLCILTLCYSTLYTYLMMHCLKKFQDINYEIKSHILQQQPVVFHFRWKSHKHELKALQIFFQHIVDLESETNKIFDILFLIKLFNSFENTVWSLYVTLMFSSASLDLTVTILAFSHNFFIAAYYLADCFADIWINQKINTEVKFKIIR